MHFVKSAKNGANELKYFHSIKQLKDTIYSVIEVVHLHVSKIKGWF
jgi:hypothetical protein